MKKIKELIQTIKTDQAELAELDKMEQKVTADIMTIADTSISTPAARAKIADASVTKALITARRSRIQAPIRVLSAELVKRVAAGVADWNHFIQEAIRQKEKEIMAASSAWFAESPDMLKPFWYQGNLNRLPVITTLRSLIYELPAQITPDREARLELAEHFLRYLEKHAATIKFDPARID